MLLQLLSIFFATSSGAGEKESASVAAVSLLAVASMIEPFAQVPCATNPSPEDSFSHASLNLQYFAEPKVSNLKFIMFFRIKIIVF